MKRVSILLLVSLLVAVSCHKDNASGFKDVKIIFSAADGASTKALMNDAALKTNGNKMRVFDELTGFSGTVSWMTGGNTYYIDDEIVYADKPVWDFVSGRAYPWTTDGEHLFFGWLSYDKTLDETVDDFCSPTFDSNTKTLSIPTLEMNKSTHQFDFMYSDMVLIDAAERTTNSPVPLQLNHLFTAFRISLNNTSGNKIILKSVVLKGLKNKRSGTIEFTSTSPAVNTDNLSSTDIEVFTSENPDGDVFIHEDLDKELLPTMLMWPQSYAELDGAQIEVVYKVIDTNGTESDELNSVVVLSNQNIFKTNSVGMLAGTKYSFQLQFKQSTIDIYTRAYPWEYEDYDWDYSENSISARSGMFKDGVLAFYRYSIESDDYTIEPTTDEWSAKAMRFTTRDEVFAGRFYIESPASGRWSINAYPESAARYFIIEPTSGDIDVGPYSDNGKCEFSVRANPDLTPESTQNLYFSVAIFFNGEWHDANSEFNRKNIRLVLDAN